MSPTARSARFSSGRSVMDFLKRTTIARMTPEALRAIGPAAETPAIGQVLEGHGLSVRARLDRLNRWARAGGGQAGSSRRPLSGSKRCSSAAWG